eukprot:11180148-Lingulodinium_polyedra.AAC.1
MQTVSTRLRICATNARLRDYASARLHARGPCVYHAFAVCPTRAHYVFAMSNMCLPWVYHAPTMRLPRVDHASTTRRPHLYHALALCLPCVLSCVYHPSAM